MHGDGSGYGGISLRSKAITRASASSAPIRMPASAQALDKVRNTTRFGIAPMRSARLLQSPSGSMNSTYASSTTTSALSASASASRRIAARGTPAPLGLLGAQTNTNFTAGVTAASTASTSSEKSPRSGASMTSTPCTRAHTAYMPNVGDETRMASAAQNARTSRSMPSSLPRPTSN